MAIYYSEKYNTNGFMEDLEMNSIFEYKDKKVYPIIYREKLRADDQYQLLFI